MKERHRDPGRTLEAAALDDGIGQGGAFLDNDLEENFRIIAINVTGTGVTSGIRVSMVGPGVIVTGWADKVSNETGKTVAKDLNEGAIPPEAVAGAVIYALDQPAEISVGDVVIHPTPQDW